MSCVSSAKPVWGIPTSVRESTWSDLNLSLDLLMAWDSFAVYTPIISN
jgi:hypothetical protein